MRNVKRKIYSSPLNLRKPQLYLLEQHSKLLKFAQQLLGLTLRVNP